MIQHNRYVHLILIVLSFLVLFITGARANISNLPNAKVKIYIDEDGIYRIGYLDLLDAGIELNQIDPHTFQLTNRGKEIPLYLGDQSKSIFEPNNYLEFYGEKNYNASRDQNEYSDTNIYYLTWGKTTGLRWKIERNDITPPAIQPFPVYPLFKDSLFRKETFTYSRTAAINENQQNLWYWRELSAPIKDNAFTFILTDLVSDSTLFGSLSVEYLGVSHAGTHYVVVGLNGNRVGEARWDGQTRYIYQCDTIPMTFFKEGRNVLQISLPGKAGDTTGKASDIDVIYMIQYKLTYWKTYTATNNELAFNPPTYHVPTTMSNIFSTPNPVSYELYGFTDSAISVYDIKHKTVVLPKITYRESAHKYTAAFTVLNEDSTTDYIALVDSRKKEPVRMEKINHQNLSQDTGGAEYLVITHDDFYQAIQPLIAWRQKTGLTTKVVKISQIYDSFNYGLIDPKPIRAFISHTYKNWNPVPKYVLLVGDASIDLRGNLNQANARLFIPTYYWSTYMGAAASDNWYVAVGNDETKPVMAIGRISAHSIAEVRNVVNKILQYEQNPVYGPWRQQMLFLASPEGMFEGISEELAKSYVPSSYEVYRRYPSSGAPDYKYRTEDIVGNINDGRIILHFTGHGGGYVWESGRMDLEQHGVEVVPDNRDFFGFKNIQQLYNYGKYPFTIALTCYTGVFDNINSDSLGEALLKSPFSGAIAVVSATWRSYVSSNDAFDRAMFTQMFQKNVRRVGDIFMNAKKEINIPETSATYVLLGDPATLLSFPKDTVQLQVIRTFRPNNRVQICGILNQPYKAQGRIILKTEKGKVVLQKNVRVSNQDTFTTKIAIPRSYAQNALVAYCYLWDPKTNWDAIGYKAIPGLETDTTKREKNIAMPPYLTSLLCGVVSNSTKNVVGNKHKISPENEAETKAQSLYEAGETFYRQKDMLNALLKYSESFRYTNRNPKLIQKLKQIVVPIETFEQRTAVQINLFKSSKPAQVIEHRITDEIAYSGKKSEAFTLTYPEPNWIDFWGKDIDIPLDGPLGVKLYARSTTPDTYLSLMVMVSFGTSHRVMFCSPLTQLELNQWVELQIDDLYQIAKKRALSQNDNVGEFKVYPELFVSHYNFDAGANWDFNHMRIQKIGFNTGGKPGQFWIDNLELYFPRNKLKYY